MTDIHFIRSSLAQALGDAKEWIERNFSKMNVEYVLVQKDAEDLEMWDVIIVYWGLTPAQL